jgi:Vault protein inter-alpha-trypsin domain/von Willebrand factor type A domain
MPESVAVPRAGLFTGTKSAVPLTGVAVDAEISNLCARVTVSQRYVNNEATPIEAVYVFPLDEASAVSGFEAIVDGTLVVGEVKERDEAFKIYDEAMVQGHGAFLLDEERPDVFQASVGNLPPGKEVLLKLTYVSELSIADGSIRFVVPTTVSPRYAPVEDRSGVGRPDSEALNPPVSWTVPYGLNLTARLAVTGPIGRIESPSHPIAIAVNGGDATVTLSQREAVLDQDFVLAVDAPALATPQAWIERNDDGDEAVAIGFAPPRRTEVSPAEVIFLVDRSGSMAGTSIEEVQNALQLCLRSLVSGCYFNIIGFGTKIDMLFPHSRLYDEATLAAATAHVSGMQADLGGTEILCALEAVFSQPRPTSMARQVVVITDGEVTNTDAVLTFVRKHEAYARVFTFGIGAGPSHHLVRGLARAGGGAAEFIMPGERASAKVPRQLARVLSPALTNVRLDWGGLEVTQAPSIVPPVFGDGRLLVYGLVKTAREKRQPTTIRLLADSLSGPVTFEVSLDPAQATGQTHRTVATLAARARIRELEEHPEWIAVRGSKQTNRKTNTLVKEIVELSLRYGLMSRETSYVAVERRETPVLGDIQLRRIPVALTRGWGDVTRVAPGAALFAGDTGVFALGGEFHRVGSRPQLRGAGPRVFGRLFGRSDPDETAAASTLAWCARAEVGTPADPVQRLIALQRADGAWKLTGALAAAIGRTLADLEKALEGLASATTTTRQVWATALALAWLERNADDAAAEWRLLALKARRWLDGLDAVPSGGRSWLDAARAELAQASSSAPPGR